MIAFEKFEEINSKDTAYKRQKEWLKDYEGLTYSKAENEKHKMKWKSDPQKYYDSIFSPDINCIGDRKDRTRIDFDDKTNGKKDIEKIKVNIERTIAKLKENGIGFIRSTHNGSSDYIWVEFDRDLTSREKDAFLMWAAPEGSEVDLNFSSHAKVFPVLFAIHWKHSMYREEPIEFFKGKKINFKELNIEVKKEEILKRKIKNRTFEYVTGIKEAAKVFNKESQAEKFNELQPIFYDRAGLFWLWNAKRLCWEITDEVDLLNMINAGTGKDIISSKNRTEIINALKQEGRKSIPKAIEPNWIQFKDKIYNITNGESINSSPEYFVTNPIPYEVSGDPRTPMMDKIFTEWVGEKYIDTLYEIIAYCCLYDYPINRLFCFIGGGMNGKTCFLNLLRKFIGISNVCSTELDTLLASRFEITRLHKKLVCMMGETNFNEMNRTSIIKKLTGNDLIGFEYKNKNTFEDINYAKILIATNNLPTTTDKTVGFYRRWLILDFPNNFSEKKNILADIPEEEYNNLATRCIINLNKILEKREFTNEGTIEERTKKYEDKSDPLEKFLKEFIYEDYNGFIWKFDFENKLNDWCKENKFRQLSEVVIGKKMKEKNILQEQRQSTWLIDGQKKQLRAWIGLKWKEEKQVTQE